MIDWGFVRPKLGEPLTLANLDQYGGVTGAAWDITEIGQLHRENEVSIDEVFVPSESDFVYRVADAWWIDEDTNIARFRCYGPDGEPHPWPSVVTNGGKLPIDSQIYVPTGSRTQSAYIASTNHKSERITWGATESSPVAPHTTLCIAWQLFPESQYRAMKTDGIYR